jgi:hypothetical protein
MGPSIIKNYPSLKMIVDQHPQILSYDDIKPFMTKGDLLAIASRRSKEIVRRCMELVQDADNFIFVDSLSVEGEYHMLLGMGAIRKGLTLSDFRAQKASTHHQVSGKSSS